LVLADHLELNVSIQKSISMTVCCLKNLQKLSIVNDEVDLDCVDIITFNLPSLVKLNLCMFALMKLEIAWMMNLQYALHED
jgi:hypothetical protein